MPDIPPRLYVIPATRAPVAVVFRRGPAKWWMLALWDLVRGTLTPGAWFRGSLYPRRCDLSPDGRLLYYFAFKGRTGGWLGRDSVAFSAVSKAPWLRALVAWRELGTYTRGYHFVEGADPAARPWEIGPPQHGDAAPLRARWGLAQTRPEQFAVELRRGWSAHEQCPPRGPNDMWDERRRSVLVKPRPHREGGRLVLTDRGYEPQRPGATEGALPAYRYELGRRTVELEDAAWADWDPRGKLLVATLGGRLQVRDVQKHEIAVVWEHDVGAYPVAPKAAPADAQRW